MTQMKHKVGDKVRIVGNTTSHYFEYGSEVEIVDHYCNDASICRYDNKSPLMIVNHKDMQSLTHPDPTQLQTMLSELKAMVEKIEQTVLEGKL